MKLFRSLTAGLVLCGMLAGCGAAPSASSSSAAPQTEPVELTVFAAASMTETMTEIAELYKKEAPDVSLVYNFDSSGTLQTQIEEGAVCDLFLSAGQKQMDALEADFVLEGTRCDLLQNKVVLIAPKGAENAPASFQAAADTARIALGGADVPVGQYSEEIFRHLGLWDSMNAAGKITFGSNVKEVLAQVEAASVDCGVVYQTDAAASDGVTVCAEAPEDSYSPAVYPAAVLAGSEHPEEAKAFLAFLKTDACKQIFEDAGFTVK